MLDADLTALLEHAFEEVPAVEATARLADARERLGGGAGGQVRSYEVVLGEDANFEGFARSVVPRMVYHFESLGVRPPDAPGAFVSIFAGERLHLVHLRDVFAFVQRRLGLSADELLARYGTGERRTPVRPDEPAAAPGGPVALLGPGPKP